MPTPGVPEHSVKISALAKRELALLVETLSTTKPVLEIGEGDLMSALILAARRSPVEVVRAVGSSYLDRKLDYAAAVSVCEFLRAYG